MDDQRIDAALERLNTIRREAGSVVSDVEYLRNQLELTEQGQKTDKFVRREVYDLLRAEFGELRSHLDALVTQLARGDWTDEQGHKAKMLKAFHDAQRALSAETHRR